MAELNEAALGKVARGKSPTTPGALSLEDYSPKVRVLQNARQLGAAQIAATVGRYDPERITMRQREQMRRDPMIALGLHFIRTPLMNADWHMECADPQVAEFANRALRPIYSTLVLQMLIALEFGYAPIVKRFELAQPDWTYRDDKGKEQPVWPSKNVSAVVWNEPRILPARGAKPLFTQSGDEFAGIEHTTVTDARGEALKIPATHALWVTNEREQSFGDWYGYPRTGYALRYWWSYWYRWLLGDRHFEQDADPPLVVYTPEKLVPDPANPAGDPISAQDLGIQIGSSLRDGATISMPSTVYESEVDGRPTGVQQWRAEFLRGGENMAAFQGSFDYLDKMKLRSLLVPEEAIVGVGGQPGQGTSQGRSVAATYGAAFAESEALLMAQIDQLINDYMLPDLIAQNFKDAPTVTKITEGFRERDMSLSTQLLTILTQNAPESLQLDVRKLAESAGLPQIDADAEPQIKDPPPKPLPALPGQASPNANQGGAPGRNINAIGGRSAPARAQRGSSAQLSLADDGLELPETAHYADPEIADAAATAYTALQDFLEDVYSGAAESVDGE
jgi:hypothetical protein